MNSPQHLRRVLQDRDLIQDKVKRDLATLLYEQGTNACLVVIVASAAIAWGTTEFKPTNTILTWWLVATLIGCFRVYDMYHWKKTIAGTEFDGRRAILRFSIYSIISAALFGCFPFIAYGHLDYFGRSITVFILAGLSAGVTTVLSSDRMLATVYTFLLLIPPSLLAVTYPGYEIRELGILGIFYWFILATSIRRNSRYILKGARLHHDNQGLAEVIAEEKRLVEESNEKLQRAYRELNEANTELEKKVDDRTQALSVLASTDDLTGLKNRHTFVETLNATIQSAKITGKQFSILFVDLDGFKEINDIRGHLIGDRVLKTIAERLQLSVKNKDFLCRWGGDEFVLVIEAYEPLVLDTISTRLCQSIQQPLNIEYDNIKITASIGIATYPQHGATSTELVNAADIAMYELKKNGKNGTMLFEAAFLEKIRFEQQLLSGLATAVENQEFDLHYQPIAPTKTNDPIIFEGLIRWKFEGVYIPPVIFIPIAETCDTIFDVGAWLLERACQDLSSNKLGINSRVSINISVRQLLSRNFSQFIQERLQQYHIEAWRLQIEVTENVFVKDLRKAKIVLEQLREMGIATALDDFGTGFSSLSYLQSLPIDTIKIDQSFVKQIDSGGEKIIEATVSIAEAFGCKVVAEGIETSAQKKRLEELGVDYLQGYYIAKPLVSEEVASYWKIEDNIQQASKR